ncbi:MAG TPA: plasmid pRiA4b ORF-3 family protein [Kofleriaceae bacterium]
MSHELFELDVRLCEIEPAIWRTVELAGACSLEDVHFALQVAMGWTNSHLHQFQIGTTLYGMTGVEEFEIKLEDERAYRLQDLVQSGDSFLYEYDFGDGWEHTVTVKKVTTVAKPPRPRCVAGARACPPEDCGGPGGYANLLAVLADPKREEHADLVAWAGGFQPERFVVPKGDLRKEMVELKSLADGDEDEVADPTALPRPLVDAVLALEPMQRASLAAVIAGSLANELLDVRETVVTLAASIKTGLKPRKRGR